MVCHVRRSTRSLVVQGGPWYGDGSAPGREVGCTLPVKWSYSLGVVCPRPVSRGHKVQSGEEVGVVDVAGWMCIMGGSRLRIEEG